MGLKRVWSKAIYPVVSQATILRVLSSSWGHNLGVMAMRAREISTKKHGVISMAMSGTDWLEVPTIKRPMWGNIPKNMALHGTVPPF